METLKLKGKQLKFKNPIYVFNSRIAEVRERNV